MKLKSAIVGTGFMGWVHLEGLRRIGVEVVGALGSSPEKSKAWASENGVPQAYQDYESVLQDPSVDVVHILTPNKTHFAMARDAIRTGKHVLCEKPLAMNSSQSAELVQLAAQHPGVVTAVNYNIRFYPLCIEAKHRVGSGQMGDVFHVHGSYTQDWLLHDTDYNWRLDAREGGELRAVADIGTHWLDLISFVTAKKVKAVCADLSIVHPVRKKPSGERQTFNRMDDSTAQTQPFNVTTEDSANILLKFDDNTRGSLVVSQVSAGRKNCLQFEIAGSKQALAWNSERPNELWVGHREQANEILTRDPALLSDSANSATSYPGGHNEGYDDSFKHSFQAFYQYIDAGDHQAPASFASFEDGHHEILVCEAILKSHRQQRWIDIEETNA